MHALLTLKTEHTKAQTLHRKLIKNAFQHSFVVVLRLYPVFCL